MSTHVRFVVEMRRRWLSLMTVETFRAWLDALEALSFDDAMAYARAVSR